MKLKELIIANFVPEETARMLERRAAWVENEEGDGWVIPVSNEYVYVFYVYFLLVLCVVQASVAHPYFSVV